MIKRTIAVRYAKALFNLDSAHENLEKRLEDFKALQLLLEKQQKLLKFLKSNQITWIEKEKIFKSCLIDKIDPLFFHFLLCLIQRKRLNYLDQIALEYRLMASKHLKVGEAKIITAVPMESETEENLRRKLEGFYHKKMNIEKKIDSKIIGGAVLVIGNELIDWSVINRLKKLKEDLLSTRV